MIVFIIATIIIRNKWPAPRRPAFVADISERRRTNAWEWETWSKPSQRQSERSVLKKCDRLSHFGPGLTLDWWKATLRRGELRIPRMALPTTSLVHLRPPFCTPETQKCANCANMLVVFFGASANLKRFEAIFEQFEAFSRWFFFLKKHLVLESLPACQKAFCT